MRRAHTWNTFLLRSVSDAAYFTPSIKHRNRILRHCRSLSPQEKQHTHAYTWEAFCVSANSHSAPAQAVNMYERKSTPTRHTEQADTTPECPHTPTSKSVCVRPRKRVRTRTHVASHYWFLTPIPNATSHQSALNFIFQFVTQQFVP